MISSAVWMSYMTQAPRSSPSHLECVFDKLVEVLVLGTHVDFGVFVGGVGAGAADEGGEDIVGFEAFLAEDGDAGGFHDLQDAVDLGGHVVGHGLALGLVGGVDDVAAGGAGVHGEHDVGGAELEEFEEHLDEIEGGVGGLAGGRAEAG